MGHLREVGERCCLEFDGVRGADDQIGDERHETVTHTGIEVHALLELRGCRGREGERRVHLGDTDANQ